MIVWSLARDLRGGTRSDLSTIISSNSDGKGGGTLAPNCDAQEALIRQVYDSAGLDPADTPFVEVSRSGTIFVVYGLIRLTF